MVIARDAAQRLIREGRAGGEMLLKPNEITGTVMVSMTRYDVQQVDHYVATDDDIKRLKEAAVT